MVQVSAVRGWDLEVDRGPDWLFVCPRPLTKDTTDRGLLADQVWALWDQGEIDVSLAWMAWRLIIKSYS